MKIEFNDALITEKDAARLLNLHPDTLKARRHKGRAPRHINIGMGRKPVIRYLRADVLAFIDACRSMPVTMEAAHA